MLDQILDRRNIEKALKQVESNGGAGGTDGMGTEELRPYLNANWQVWRAGILEGTYRPSPVRKVEIPKPQGGTRMLGIPSVKDRLLQQAISQWLQPIYEPTFSAGSYGFRPGKSAHQAVYQALSYLKEGKTWVVELDLEKFFDRVNHDRLMARLSKRITDKRTLKLIRSYLTSGVMEGGMISPRREGTPQGSPLSPILSNIVLDELDKELEQRGHTYVRYADDCSVYVKSEAAAKRVMDSITVFIEEKLKLKVNRDKTKISQASQSILLGFSFYVGKEGWGIRIPEGSIQRTKRKCKSLTHRNAPGNIRARITKLEEVIRGWVNYFSIAKARKWMEILDAYVRTRLRIGIWKQWKRIRTRIINLVKLGVPKNIAYQWGNSSKGYCRMAHSTPLKVTLTNEYFQRLGYVGFCNRYKWQTQKTLF